ncbi:hypothetical protein EDB83DRAFT_2670771 [Lactarius deliciosus]|nr:hypothetical protein EDB83DRAFT_2670771 [Lactarius deliciosus]
MLSYGSKGYSWRMAGDSTPTSEYIKSIMSINVAHLSSVDFFSHNDMDMMEIGTGNLTIEDHFAVWALMKSPILLGTDAAPSPEEDTTEGKPALPFTPPNSISTDPPQFYSGGSAKGIHVFIVNTNDEPTTFKLDFVDVLGLNSSSAGVHDMWTFTNMGIFSTSFNVALAVHDIAALLVTPVSQKQSVSNDNVIVKNYRFILYILMIQEQFDLRLFPSSSQTLAVLKL